MALASYNTYPIAFPPLREENMLAYLHYRWYLTPHRHVEDHAHFFLLGQIRLISFTAKRSAGCGRQAEAEDGGEADLSPMQEVF